MAFTDSTMRNCQLLVTTTFALAALSTAALAYTAEQQQMCTGDAMRLCSSEIPDVDRVTACMVQKRAQLSDGCKAVFQYVPPAASPASYAPAAKPARPLSLTPHKRG
ncbi:hypothetical protein ACVWVY_003373 [Bradyrhizobium sp. URHC0002]